MRTVVIGGTGHIGTYLVPSLVRAGHDTVVISRGSRRPYREDPLWSEVEMVTCDRDAAESDGEFGMLVAGLGADAVVDLTCFTVDQARQLVEALDGQHLVHTGSIWSYGPSTIVPTTEAAPKHPYGDYGVGKLEIERYLMGQERVRASVVHPGHISGPGWMPIGPAGNVDPAVIDALRADGSCVLPDRGLETIQHVHAEDVAGLHQACLEQPDAAAGESFNSVCTEALTLRGYAELVARHFGHEPRLELVPWAEFVDAGVAGGRSDDPGAHRPGPDVLDGQGPRPARLRAAAQRHRHRARGHRRLGGHPPGLTCSRVCRGARSVVPA